jgi:hypothetical protein
MLHTLATKETEMLGPEDKAELTTERISRLLSVFLLTEILLKIERLHRPGGNLRHAKKTSI